MKETRRGLFKLMAAAAASTATLKATGLTEPAPEPKLAKAPAPDFRFSFDGVDVPVLSFGVDRGQVQTLHAIGQFEPVGARIVGSETLHIELYCDYELFQRLMADREPVTIVDKHIGFEYFALATGGEMSMTGPTLDAIMRVDFDVITSGPAR